MGFKLVHNSNTAVLRFLFVIPFPDGSVWKSNGTAPPEARPHTLRARRPESGGPYPATSVTTAPCPWALEPCCAGGAPRDPGGCKEGAGPKTRAEAPVALSPAEKCSSWAFQLLHGARPGGWGQLGAITGLEPCGMEIQGPPGGAAGGFLSSLSSLCRRGGQHGPWERALPTQVCGCPALGLQLPEWATSSSSVDVAGAPSPGVVSYQAWGACDRAHRPKHMQRWEGGNLRTSARW